MFKGENGANARSRRVGNRGFIGWLTELQSTSTHNVLRACPSHNLRLYRVQGGRQQPAFCDKPNKLTTKSLIVMTWLWRRVSWFSWSQGPKQPRRTCRGDRSFSTLQPQHHSSGRPLTWPAPFPQLVPCWQPPGTPRWFSRLPTPAISKIHQMRGLRGEWFGETDLRPFSVTDAKAFTIPSLFRRDRAVGNPRSLTIERNVSALRLSHGNTV